MYVFGTFEFEFEKRIKSRCPKREKKSVGVYIFIYFSE
jgi:hypothetical protein